MKTNYTITAGTHPNSIEIYFDSKPALDVLDALKALKFRWNLDNSPRLKPGDSRLNDHCLQEQV